MPVWLAMGVGYGLAWPSPLRAGTYRLETMQLIILLNPATGRPRTTYVKKIRPQAGLELVVSNSQAQLTTVPAGRLASVSLIFSPISTRLTSSPAGSPARGVNNMVYSSIVMAILYWTIYPNLVR